MTRLWLLPLALLALPALAADVDRLRWLAGCWASAGSGAEAGSGEAWMAPAGGSLLGVSRTVKAGKTVAHEFMQIRAGSDGQLMFVAEPAGQRRTEFKLLTLSDDEAVFENPAHDFPQRVAYRLEAPDTLRARIEGRRGGGPLRTIEFPMRRNPCH